MSATHMSPDHTDTHPHPWIEVTERSDGHALPFATGILLFLASAILSILLTGLP